MADLIMTIDSDSESEVKAPTQKNMKNKQKKDAKNSKEEEEILLSHSIILPDTNDNQLSTKKHTKGHIVGSNNLWNFSESLQVDRRATM